VYINVFTQTPAVVMRGVCVCVRERVCVCVSESESVCVCVCESESEKSDREGSVCLRVSVKKDRER